MSDSTGFDAASFAAKMSSIGHSGNMSSGGGAPGSNIGTLDGPLSPEFGTNSGNINQAIEAIGTSSTLKISIIFKLITSLLESLSTMIVVDALFKSLGTYTAPITPIKLATPSQLMVGGSGGGGNHGK